MSKIENQPINKKNHDGQHHEHVFRTVLADFSVNIPDDFSWQIIEIAFEAFLMPFDRPYSWGTVAWASVENSKEILRKTPDDQQKSVGNLCSNFDSHGMISRELCLGGFKVGRHWFGFW